MSGQREENPDNLGDLSQCLDLQLLAMQMQRLGRRRRRDWDTLCAIVPQAIEGGMSESEAARRSGMSRDYIRKLIGKTS